MTRRELERGLDTALAEAQLLVLDLRGLTLIDPEGVHAIVAGSARARRAGRRLILVRGSAQVDEIFTLTGVAGELEIHDLDFATAPVECRGDPSSDLSSDIDGQAGSVCGAADCSQ